VDRVFTIVLRPEAFGCPTMATKQKDSRYRSFLLRLWQEGEAETSATWRGEVESIQTGRKWQFDSLELIISYLRTQILADPTNNPDQKKD
jgi:hypothetical protein